MGEVLLYLLSVYGAVFLLRDAKIFDDFRHGGWVPIRPLVMRLRFMRSLFACPFCLAVWVGAGLWLMTLLWTDEVTVRNQLFQRVFAGSAFTYLAYRITRDADHPYYYD